MHRPWRQHVSRLRNTWQPTLERTVNSGEGWEEMTGGGVPLQYHLSAEACSKCAWVCMGHIDTMQVLKLEYLDVLFEGCPCRGQILLRIPTTGKFDSTDNTDIGVNLTLTIAGLLDGDETGLLPHPDPTSSVQRASHQQDFVMCGRRSTFQWHARSLWKTLRDSSASGHRPSSHLSSHQGRLKVQSN